MGLPAPYVTVEMFRAYPHGLDLSSVPYPGATQQQQDAEILRAVTTATNQAMAYCSQELRATTNVEREAGPDWTITVQRSTGIAEMRLKQFPVTAVIGARVSPASSFPPGWTTVPASALRTKRGVLSEYGSVAPNPAAVGPDTLQIAPGYVTWGGGRNGTLIEATYVAGWPHTILSAPVLAGATTITVDDCTGWTGVVGRFHDGASTEDVLVSAQSVAAGPGSLTLAAPTLFAHSPVAATEPILFSALPLDIMLATYYYAIEQLLVRGASAVTVPAVPGTETNLGVASGDLNTEAEVLLSPFRRIVF